MSEWINRSDRGPGSDDRCVFLFSDGDVEVMRLSGANNWPWTHWMPLPATPPRTVTIEISEEDAAQIRDGGSSSLNSTWNRVAEACRNALEAKR